MRLENFIFSLGILNVGLSNARLLCKRYNYSIDDIRKAEVSELIEIEGYGEIIAKSINDYFTDDEKGQVLDELLSYITFEAREENTSDQIFEGKVFVVTGSVNHYDNRKALQAEIESLGGKVTGSVTSKTSYLINNNVTSSTGKNKKAKELGIPIISEEDYMAML